MNLPLIFVFAEKNCDMTVYGPGYIESPNYGKYYGEDRHCLWDVVLPRGSFAVLKFLEIDLEPKETSRVVRPLE